MAFFILLSAGLSEISMRPSRKRVKLVSNRSSVAGKTRKGAKIMAARQNDFRPTDHAAPSVLHKLRYPARFEEINHFPADGTIPMNGVLRQAAIGNVRRGREKRAFSRLLRYFAHDKREKMNSMTMRRQQVPLTE